jgi:hypothetical protein
MFCNQCLHCNNHKITQIDIENIERKLPPGEINTRKCLSYLLMKFGGNTSQDYEKTIKALYETLIWGRISKDVRKDKLIEEFKNFADKIYELVEFEEDCPVGDTIPAPDYNASEVVSGEG